MDFLAKAKPVPQPPQLEPWKVLIVDDDPDVHDATRIALTGCELEGRGLKLYHAKSMAEAKEILQAEADIAVSLVDVVMETETAGLDLVSWIRGDQHNHFTRLILRTGQPGYAPQTDVIKKYEIDDYKEKAELTRAKLITTIITALRGYKLIISIERNRRSLKKLIKNFGVLIEKNDMREFAACILEQIANMVGIEPEAMICAVDSENAETASNNDVTIKVLAAGGAYTSCISKSLDLVPSEDMRNTIRQCILSGETQKNPGNTCLSLMTRNGLRAAVFVGIPYDVLERRLGAEVIELFVINTSLGYEKTALVEHIRKLAFEDHLTGLPSYAAYREAFHTQQALGQQTTTVLLDIQRYKMIAHGIGDEKAANFLKNVGQRLRKGFPKAHVLARKEVDEFVLLLDRVKADEITEVVEIVERLFDEPVAVGDNVFNIRMRLGFSNSEDHGTDPDQLSRYASIALNDLRQRGVGTYSVFNPSMQEIAFERLRLTSLLTGTAGKTEFLVHYQPILEANSEKLYSCEALMRFRTTAGDYLHTGRMIEAAEASGMIIDVGAWMIKAALSEYMSLGALGPDINLNLNLSPKQAQSTRIYRDIQKALDISGMPMDRLVFEVTEGLFLNNDRETIAFLEWIQQQGGRVVIDDFGTGYSSFSYLRKLPVDGIKIDRAFIMHMDEDEDALAVVKSILAVAKALGLTVTAEGVETIEQRNILRDLECDYLQGFLYSKAVPGGEIPKFMAQSSPAGIVSVA
ncbi:EAL domain-containing protein [Roseibium hamelinense]|nr:EAL domain-containing protein [Roseibium hamelinense]